MATRTILITGGAGFAGSNLLQYLFKRYPDYRLIVLDALTYAGGMDNIPDEIQNSSRFEFWYGDVRNVELVDKLVGMSTDVVHLAAETHVTRSIFDNLRFFETDVMGTQSVSTAVLKHKARIDRFIHFSTSEVYGTAEQERMDETHPLNPKSPYAAAKAGADRLVYSYVATYDIPAVIVRPFNMYGFQQHLEKVVPRFITSAILEEDLTIHGDGSARRDFIYVGDVVDAIDLLLHAPRESIIGEVFNIGTGKDRSVYEVACSVAKHFGVAEDRFCYVGERPAQVERHTANADKIRQAIGWTPKTDFADGIETTVAWYRANQPWWKKRLHMRHVPIATKEGKRQFH